MKYRVVCFGAAAAAVIVALAHGAIGPLTVGIGGTLLALSLIDPRRLLALLGAGCARLADTFAGLAFICIVMSTAAHAATLDPVVAQSAWGILMPLVSSIALGFITLALRQGAAALQARTGIALDQKAQDDLHRAAATGVDLALNKLGPSVIGVLSDPHRSGVIAAAIEWVLASVPGAVARLGVTPGLIEGLVVAKLPGMIGGLIANHGPVTPAPVEDPAMDRAVNDRTTGR